jgi:hypothetical protein
MRRAGDYDFAVDDLLLTIDCELELIVSWTEKL